MIADNKWEYFKLWLRVGLRNPLQYMVAEVRQTCGYWAFTRRDYEYVYGEYFMVDNPFGITTQRKLFTYDDELAMHDFLMGFQDLYNKVWSLYNAAFFFIANVCSFHPAGCRIYENNCPLLCPAPKTTGKQDRKSRKQSIRIAKLIV